MSFTSLLRHTVVVRRRFAVLDGGGLPTYDGLGQPRTALLPVETVRCRIQPLEARELALLSQAGAVVADHRLYMVAGTDVTEADQLVPSPADGRVFEVKKIDDLGGAGRYLELRAQLITSHEVPES